jgi:hypothetical protein
MLKKMNWKPMSPLAIMVALSLTACASLTPQTPEKLVEKRATQYWKARIEGRIDSAYALISPAYRAVRSTDQYKARFGKGSVKATEVVGVTCEPQKCSVKMKLVAGVALPMIDLRELVTHVDEVWLLEDGNWWRYEEL